MVTYYVTYIIIHQYVIEKLTDYFIFKQKVTYVIILYHRGLDPLGRPHQLLHSSVNYPLVFRREHHLMVLNAGSRPLCSALVVLLHFDLPLHHLLHVLLLLDPAPVHCFLWLCRSMLAKRFCGPFGDAAAAEHFECEFVEKILDDVHHVRADVPDQVEQEQKGQGACFIHPCRFPGVCFGRTSVHLAFAALLAGFIVRPEVWGVSRTLGLGAELGLLAERVSRWAPTTFVIIVYKYGIIKVIIYSNIINARIMLS